MKGNNAQSHTSHKLGDYRIDCPEQDTFANEGEQFESVLPQILGNLLCMLWDLETHLAPLLAGIFLMA